MRPHDAPGSADARKLMDKLRRLLSCMHRPQSCFPRIVSWMRWPAPVGRWDRWTNLLFRFCRNGRLVGKKRRDRVLSRRCRVNGVPGVRASMRAYPESIPRYQSIGLQIPPAPYVPSLCYPNKEYTTMVTSKFRGTRANSKPTAVCSNFYDVDSSSFPSWFSLRGCWGLRT